LEKAARDETATVADTDPAMAAAMHKAQSTLADFLKVAAAPKPGTQGFSLKVAVREGERVEYFWITPFTNNGIRFSGEINNTPRVVHSVKLGQTITFAQSDIVDWLYIENGMMRAITLPARSSNRRRKTKRKSSKKPSGSIAIYENGFCHPLKAADIIWRGLFPRTPAASLALPRS
jgi:uncharacterized protein YegJ (DUF2314 family)